MAKIKQKKVLTIDDKLNRIKVINQEGKSILKNLFNENKNKIAVLTEKQYSDLKNSYIGKTEKQNFKNSFEYAIARIIMYFGFDYKKIQNGTYKNSKIEDKSRINFDDDLKIYSIDFIQ